MEVLGFQLFFFALILASGLFGRKIRNVVTIISIIFTLVMVFMTWLIILQFVTIAIAFIITQKYVQETSLKLESADNSSSRGCLYLIVGGGVLMIILKLCSDRDAVDSQTTSETSNREDSAIFTSDSANYFSPEIYSAEQQEDGYPLYTAEDVQVETVNDYFIAPNEVIYQFEFDLDGKITAIY